MKKVILFLCALSLVVGCGGGGGGGGGGRSGAFYGGIWDFTGLNLTNNCGAFVPDFTSVRMTVNQDGNRVVVNSGTVVLDGVTNPEDDGFDVTATSVSSNGCPTAYAYSFKDASDGEAAVGLALSVQ